MGRVKVVFLLLLFCLSRAEIQNNEISEGKRSSAERVFVEQPQLYPPEISEGKRSGAEGVFVEQPQLCPPDLHTVLRDMSARLAENRLMIQQLQLLNQEQATRLKELQITEVNPMKEQLKENTHKLREVAFLKLQQQEQADKLMDLQTRDVEPIKEQLRVGKVAFSASLLESGAETTGPFNTDTTLVFRHVVSNMGNAYNSNTGFFTAPLRGAYHFEFYIYALMDGSHVSSVALVKNGENVFVASENQKGGGGAASNGATLLLETGDVVFLRLISNTRVYDNEYRPTTFSGHLLFPMIH